jgi:catechol 2,3-dioxygenase-like lactoylglutathione lyase family enzyme
MITGFHTIIYSDDADATRAFFRDVLEWPSVDAGGGWLIFKTPPAEMGVHPTLSDTGHRWASIPHAQLSVMCDDLVATVALLEAKGVEVADGVRNEGFGLVTEIEVPGAGAMMLYQPLHPVAHELDG